MTTLGSFPPLASWPREVGAFEPAHGWFQRLAEVNSSYSAIRLADLVGLNGRNIVLSDVSEFCAAFPTPGIEKLTDFTPKIVDNGVEVNGLILNDKVDFSIRRPRICPGCILESRHYRNWFDIQIIGGCPIHGQRLLCGPVRDKLAWWHPKVGVTPSGIDLSTNLEKARPFPWEGYVLGRMGVIPATSNDLLDNCPMQHAVSFAVFMGHVAKVPGIPHLSRVIGHRASLAGAGFEYFSEGRAGLEHAFRGFARNAREGGHDDVWRLGFMTSRFGKMPKGCLQRTVQDVFAAARQAEGIRQRRFLSDQPKLNDTALSLKKLSVEIGLTTEATIKLAKKLGYYNSPIGRGKSYIFSNSTSQIIKNTVKEFVKHEEASEYTGIPQKEFERLLKINAIAPFIRSGGANVWNNLYSRDELDNLIHRTSKHL